MRDERGRSPRPSGSEPGGSPSESSGASAAPNPGAAYGSVRIEVLEGWQAVRRRPGMYVGDVHDGTGLEHMVWEIAANAVDQHLSGYARTLSVSVDSDGLVEVADDGAGISLHEVGGRTYLEDVLTHLHATPTRDHHFPHVHLGLAMRGLGMLPVAALSSRFEVDTTHGGQRATYSLVRGLPVAPPVIEPSARRTGTRIRFLPDPEIFGAATVSRESVAARLGELAWLLPHLEIRWCGEVLPGRGGLFELVRSWGAVGPILATRREIESATVDLAIAWAQDTTTRIRSFVNYQPSVRGTHITGLFEGLAEIATAHLVQLHAAEVRERLAPGLRAVVHVGLLDPSFGAPTRDHLVSPLASVVTRRAIVEAHDALAGGRWRRAGAPAPSSPFTRTLLARLVSERP